MEIRRPFLWPQAWQMNRVPHQEITRVLLNLISNGFYTRVATKTIQQIISPLEHIARKVEKVEPPA